MSLKQTLPRLIIGNMSKDHRGEVSFFNTFDMSHIKRFYVIHHFDTDIIRGWQGHKMESKWFYCVEGSFKVNYVKVDDWTTPDTSAIAESCVLSSAEAQVLEVPGGFVTCFQALEVPAKLMVYSDFDLDASKADDYRFNIDTWKR